MHSGKIYINLSIPAVSDQSLSVSFTPEEVLDPWLPIERPFKTLIRLCKCTGWFESLMGGHANLYLLLDTCSFMMNSQCPLLITFENSLDPDQVRHTVGSDLDPNYLTLWWYCWIFFSKRVILKKISRWQNSMKTTQDAEGTKISEFGPV